MPAGHAGNPGHRQDGEVRPMRRCEDENNKRRSETVPVHQSPDHSLAPAYPKGHPLSFGPVLQAPFVTDLDHEPTGPEKHALALCSRYCRLADVGPPFGAATLAWRGSAYVYVFGRDSVGRRRLFEVFRDLQDALEPVLAFQYPMPLRKLFRDDLDPLYSDRR